MNDYLEWPTSGLIFLWILGAHDARAAPVGSGDVRWESCFQKAYVPALSPPARMFAADSSAASLPAVMIG